MKLLSWKTLNYKFYCEISNFWCNPEESIQSMVAPNDTKWLRKPTNYKPKSCQPKNLLVGKKMDNK